MRCARLSILSASGLSRAMVRGISPQHLHVADASLMRACGQGCLRTVVIAIGDPAALRPHKVPALLGRYI
jgi:hypothetical protein